MDNLILMLLFSLVCASILLIYISSIFNQTSKHAKLPPGPRPFPIIGNILELGRNPHQTLTKLSKIYGPVMSLKLGNITTIVISSPQAAKEVLNENSRALSSRTVPHASQVLDHHKHSIVWLPPEDQWRTLRKACAAKMFSPQQIDSTQILRQKKVQELLDYVKESCKKGEVFDIGEVTFTTVVNTISNTLFSIDLVNYTSDKSQEFKDLIWSMMQEVGRPNVADFFPILRPLDPQCVHERVTGYFTKLFNIFDGIIEERMNLRVSKTDSMVCNDVLESLLDIGEGTSSHLGHYEILHLFMDLFVAGIDTTSSTIEWTMAELLQHPEKLAEVRKELHQVIGKDVTIEESHILKLPFLQAVVKETLRLHPPGPLLLPHKSDERVEICGFTVPKNAQVLVNVWGMGRDPSIWENPNLFVPERFLESEIDFKGRDFELIPFGSGKRICPGLPLANRLVHLILASLLHNYDWKLADGLMPENMNMKEHFRITLKRVQPLRVQPIGGENI